MSDVSTVNSSVTQSSAPAFYDATMQSNVIKYTVAASLPTSVLNLFSKFTGGELLTDRYANRIFQQTSAAIGGTLKTQLGQTGGLLAGQSEQFFQDAGQAAFDVSKQFLAGHIKQEGWQHIDSFVEKTVGDIAGKGLMAPVVKALSNRIWGNLKTDLEKQLHVQNSSDHYISQTMASGRDALVNLITQYTVPHIRGDNREEKAAFVESFKKAAISTLESPALGHTLAQLISSQLVGSQIQVVDQLVESLIPNQGIGQTVMRNLWSATKTQLQKESAQVVENGNEKAPSLTESLQHISQEFLRDYLQENRWNLVNDYAHTALSTLPPNLQPIGREIWIGMKQDIYAYAQSTAGPDNTVEQMVQLGQQFARGYVSTFGWDAIDTYIHLNLDAALMQGNISPQTQLLSAVGKQLWEQVKGELNQSLHINKDDPHNATFLADTVASGGRLLSTIVGQDRVTSAVGQMVGDAVGSKAGNIAQTFVRTGVLTGLEAEAYSQGNVLGYAVSQMMSPALGQIAGEKAKAVVGDTIQQTVQSTMTTLMQQLFTQTNVVNNPSPFSLAGVIAKGAGTTQTALTNTARTYLAGQGFTTLDKAVSQQIEKMGATTPEQNLSATGIVLPLIWSQLKTQMTTELFGSAEEFSVQQTLNKDSPLSVLVDISLSKALGVTSPHPSDTLSMGKVVANLSYHLTQQMASGAVTMARDQLNLASQFLEDYFQTPIEDPEERAQIATMRAYLDGLSSLVINDQSQPEDIIQLALATFQSPDDKTLGNLTERINACVTDPTLRAQLLDIAARLSPEQLQAFDRTNTYTITENEVTTVQVSNRTTISQVGSVQLAAIQDRLTTQLTAPAPSILAGHQVPARFSDEFSSLNLQLKENNYSYADVGINLFSSFWNNDGLSNEERQTLTVLFNTTQQNEALFTATTQFLNPDIARDTVMTPIWETFQAVGQDRMMILGTHSITVSSVEPAVSYKIEDHGELGVMIAIEAKWQIENSGTEKQSVAANTDGTVIANTYFYLRPDQSSEGGVKVVYNEQTSIAAIMNNTLLFSTAAASPQPT